MPRLADNLAARWRAWGTRMFADAADANSANMASRLGPEHRTVLDLGCWDGSHLEYVPVSCTIFGAERSEAAAAAAAERGVRVLCCDLNRGLAFRSATFDAVTSNQVIEHLWDTDTFVSEAFRLLRPGGLIAVSTENLASWHNVASLIMGWQAFSLTNVSGLGSLGNPLAILRGAEPFDKGWQHLRIFSYKGLRELFEDHGFVEVDILGAGYSPVPTAVGRADPRHAAFITAVATKPGATHVQRGRSTPD